MTASHGAATVVCVDAASRRQWPVDGASLSVLAAGSSGPPVVCLHGIPTGAELWRPVLGRLAAAGWRALAPDLPGYGSTRLPRGGDHSLAGGAELVARWLTGAGLAPAWIVGHDAGGAVAQLLAVRHPHVVGRLTLTNSIVDGSWPAPRARFGVLAARLHLVRAAGWLRLVPNPYVRWAVRRAFADPRRAATAPLDAVVWDTKFTDPEGRAAFERSLAALDPADTALAAPGLSRIRVPCQLVWGMADPYQTWPVAGRRLVELLPDPAVARLEGCGHFTPLECDDGLVEAMLAWQASTPDGEPV